MPRLEEKMSVLAEQVLQRPMSKEEMDEIYRISDAVGMRDVQSFLHLLLVFKLHEDTMKKRFDEMAALEKKIHETLASSIGEILSEGSRKIGTDMGEAIASRAEKLLASVQEYHSLRGQTLIACFLFLTLVFGYGIGRGDFLSAIPKGGFLEAFLFLPAGWGVFFCGSFYCLLWSCDHWKRINKTVLYKTILGVQILFLVVVALFLL